MGCLLFLLLSAAHAEDCALHERDYLALQQTLRTMHRHSDPFTITARGQRCQAALQAVLRNAPLLHAALTTDERNSTPETCTLMLHASPDGFVFDPGEGCDGLRTTPGRLVYGRPSWPLVGIDDATGELLYPLVLERRYCGFGLLWKRRNWQDEMGRLAL